MSDSPTQIDQQRFSRRGFLRKLAAGSAVGGAAVALGGAFAPPTANAIATDVDPASYIIYMSSGTTYALNGTTGNVDYSNNDAAVVINNVITALSNAGGGSVFIRNQGSPYPVNSQVLFKSLVDVESDGAVLQGNSGLQYPFASPNNSVLYRATIRGLVLDANNTSNGVCLTVYSVQRSKFDIFMKNCVFGMVIQIAPNATPIESILGIASSLSEYSLQFDNVIGNTSTWGAALQLIGTQASPVTNNDFKFFRATRLGTNSPTNYPAVGIRLVEWCDTNRFDHAFISMGGNNSMGVVFNDSNPGGPTQDVGVYNIQFDKLSVDAFGISSASGVFFNNCRQIQINQMFGSPGPPYPGSFINNNGCQSYEIGDYLTNQPKITRRLLNVTTTSS